jgi:preprotein translocase subunit YajC
MAKKPLKEGDRVVHNDGRMGIVCATEHRRVQIHWGTFNRIEFKEWIPKADLTLDERHVATPDEIAERQKKTWLGDLAEVGSRVEPEDG